MSEKPLKDWTLGEIKDYCAERLHRMGDSVNTCQTCKLGDVCCKDPTQWNLDSWTEQDIEDAKAIKRVFPDADEISRTKAGSLSILKRGAFMFLDNTCLVQSLQPGSHIMIADILKKGGK